MKKLSKLIVCIFIFNIVFTNYSYALENREEILKNENNLELKTSTSDENILKENMNKEPKLPLDELESKLWIDGPRGTINNKDININGWALNSSGVREVKIYIDGEYKGNAEVGKQRLDVNAAYPGYLGGENSGYEMTIDKNKVSPGKHELKVEAIGIDGSSKSEVVSIEVVKLENILWIDEPRVTIENKDIKVRGWALNSSGVREVKIYVDGKYKGNAEVGKERLDVNVAYPGYPGGENSGYEMTIDKNQVSPGKHELKVEAIGIDGSIKTEFIEFKLNKPHPKTFIDTPNNIVNLRESEFLEIKGWAINQTDISNISVYLDNRFVGNANKGLSRLDVGSIYSDYPNSSNSGFELLLNKESIIPGEHRLTVVQEGFDGSTDSQTVIFKVRNGLIMIDPGHGGRDSGAVGSGFQEKTLNLDISLAAYNYLKMNGYEVVMTRSTELPSNQKLELRDRSSMANTLGVDYFISIHNDSGGGNGTHVIYSLKDRYGGPSKTLAKNLLDSVVLNTSQNASSRGIWTRTGSDGRDYYHVIREVEAPSVIIECSYMDTNDIQAVNTHEKRVKMGNAIAKGIINTIE
ncbi:mannosyl-glycoprotein endo-beta-N-acetylglucosaminidase [[Clostridium] sordellii]|uniref:N-acetylmuramoyl-L-alanine amidase n=1 Tax=Paraclostridium sordellii TaxID=1505 RepID=UPI0005E5C886|nr:N-acetylmuramoyl-L-alanine amidase [Paeniclostridium sordellii]CEQ10472.1 mannosyl-glycoprotein endo-beta-N-acetylglucosaminidase [[Clostridium] sordellii] [Paeniclostridium sordellii]